MLPGWSVRALRTWRSWYISAQIKQYFLLDCYFSGSKLRCQLCICIFVYVYVLVHNPYDLGTIKHTVFHSIFIVIGIEKKMGFLLSSTPDFSQNPSIDLQLIFLDNKRGGNAGTQLSMWTYTSLLSLLRTLRSSKPDRSENHGAPLWNSCWDYRIVGWPVGF